MICEGRGFLEKPRFLKTEPDKKLAVSKVASTVLRSTPADEDIEENYAGGREGERAVGLHRAAPA
jgi:hypothetical protein